MHNVQKPKVLLLRESGLGVAEIAARTCYDSFENSENSCVKDFTYFSSQENINKINTIEHSDLLHQLAWVHHHHSILEHISLTYYIEGTGRGVLQEHARHRIQSLSVRSTRYTMSSILFAFIASLRSIEAKSWFSKKMIEMDIFIQNDDYRYLLASQLWEKLNYHLVTKGSKEFMELILSKENIEKIKNYASSEDLFFSLMSGKKKRNVGDGFKDIVDDNWKTNLVCTFNLRSLKNYFSLRDSGAAFFQIQMLAQAMKEVTPQKYLDLIIKNN